ncbi:hypothetical protein [Dyadobacter flavalbus]|uniref:hypothetical protein n=1 Tax=Dyadobacter flavalbus TaxID=2579942 RepID=UPI001375932D|nr:hypothetical protein [Dyadobacter flavalbus]
MEFTNKTTNLGMGDFADSMNQYKESTNPFLSTYSTQPVKKEGKRPRILKPIYSVRLS